jgi:hypothetical protein
MGRALERGHLAVGLLDDVIDLVSRDRCTAEPRPHLRLVRQNAPPDPKHDLSAFTHLYTKPLPTMMREEVDSSKRESENIPAVGQAPDDLPESTGLLGFA